MEAGKTSHSGAMCCMEERFWSCPKSSSRCKCGVWLFITIMVSRNFPHQIEEWSFHGSCAML
jgi:hypothetical protein